MASKRSHSGSDVLAGLRIVFMVSAFFIGLGSACGDDANGPIAQPVGHGKDAAVDHADDVVAVLAIVRAIIESLGGERVLEHLLGRLETHAMIGKILSGFGLVPFEV